jgi:hypothetical protein
MSLVGCPEAVNHHHFCVHLEDQQMVFSNNENFSLWGTNSKQNTTFEGAFSILDFYASANLNI